MTHYPGICNIFPSHLFPSHLFSTITTPHLSPQQPPEEPGPSRFPLYPHPSTYINIRNDRYDHTFIISVILPFSNSFIPFYPNSTHPFITLQLKRRYQCMETTDQEIRREKVFIPQNMTTREVMQKYGASKSCALNARKRGWFIKNYMANQVIVDWENFNPAVSYILCLRSLFRITCREPPGRTSGSMSTRSISPRRELYEPEARDAPLLIFEFVRRARGLVYLHADGFTALSAETLSFLATALRMFR